MGSERVSLSSSGEAKISDGCESAKIIEWEELQQELARLWSLSSALNKAKEKKGLLVQKLDSLIKVREESLHRSNELEEMHQKLEARKSAMGTLLMQSKSKSEDIKNQEEQLSIAVRSLLVAGKSLSTAFNQLQEANRLLAGERGHVHLNNLQKMLRTRQQYMITHVSSIYPVKASIKQTPGEKLDSLAKGSKSGNCDESSSSTVSKDSKPVTSGMPPLTILGLQLTAPPLKKLSFFSDKKEIQRSATALGYVAHAVLLIASYLDVPLRYPLRLGGSRSYILDYAPSIEPTSSDLALNTIPNTNSKFTEFPLFLEGQDTTRAAYAIFLLNKDLEQLLNYIGIQSLGPRHVLANLNQLLRSIQSQEYLHK